MVLIIKSFWILMYKQIQHLQKDKKVAPKYEKIKNITTYIMKKKNNELCAKKTLLIFLFLVRRWERKGERLNHIGYNMNFEVSLTFESL